MMPPSSVQNTAADPKHRVPSSTPNTQHFTGRTTSTQNGPPVGWKRRGLQRTWRAATASRLPDYSYPTELTGDVSINQLVGLQTQYTWNDAKAATPGGCILPDPNNSILPHPNAVSHIPGESSSQPYYDLIAASRSSTHGHRIQPKYSQKKTNPLRPKLRNALDSSPNESKASTPQFINVGPAKKKSEELAAGQSQNGQNLVSRDTNGTTPEGRRAAATYTRRPPEDLLGREQFQNAEVQRAATNSRQVAAGVRVVKANTSVLADDASFFHTVSFGHSDQEFFATSQVGCFYDGINRELERILLELSEMRREGKPAAKLLPRVQEETDEAWGRRHIPTPKLVVLGPAHQFYCSLAGRASLRTTLLQSNPAMPLAELNQKLADRAPGCDEENKAFFRCNSGSTSLSEQIQGDPLGIEFLTFGFKPDSYFCFTADQIFHNRLPPDMVQTMESELMDIECVQLWKGDGWFIKDNEDNIYFNNICDLTLLDILDHHHPYDPIEHFSISLNGLNWYVRTASGTEFYKSQALRNIQQKHDPQFAESACLIRASQAGN